MSRYIVAQTNKFLRQKDDYDWLIAPCVGGGGKDDFQERVVYTTFPGTLSKSEFEEYVDFKFSSLNQNNRNKIKALFNAITDIDMEKSITFEYETDGAISAMLTQILFERCGNELRVSVGYIKFIRRPTKGWHFLRDYWKSNEEKTVKGLQYKYAKQLENELY